MFAESPALPDAPLFAIRIEETLGRGWALRRLMIGAAGVLGGGIAVAQVVGANLAHQVSEFTHTLDTAGHSLTRLSQASPLVAQAASLTQLPFGGEIVWLVLGLALLAGGLLASRSIDPF